MRNFLSFCPGLCRLYFLTVESVLVLFPPRVSPSTSTTNGDHYGDTRPLCIACAPVQYRLRFKAKPLTHNNRENFSKMFGDQKPKQHTCRAKREWKKNKKEIHSQLQQVWSKPRIAFLVLLWMRERFRSLVSPRIQRSRLSLTLCPLNQKPEPRWK